MRSRPPGTKSGTIEETEDWDDVVFGTSELAVNYSKYTLLYMPQYTCRWTHPYTIPANCKIPF